MSWSDVFTATLETPRVVMRPLVPEDREALDAIVWDADIWRYFVQRVDDRAGLDAFIAAAVADREAGTRAVFAVVERATGRVVGSMALANFAQADRRVEIGWSWLGREWRGTGLNRHAKLALLTYAFQAMGCERVEFKTDVLNEQAKRGLRNIGAVEEGVLRSYNYMPDGRRRDAWKEPSEIDLVWTRDLAESLAAEAQVHSGTHCAAKRCRDFRSTEAYPLRDYEFVSDHCPVILDLTRADDD